MSDKTPIEEIEVPEDMDGELRDLLDQEPPEFHTILEVWREVLKTAPDEADKPVTPAWANRIQSAFPQIKIQDMNAYRDMYYGIVEDMRQIVEFEISTDEAALEHNTAEDDRTFNAAHYKNVIRDWQLLILNWEISFDCTDEDAHIQIAAYSEAHKMFLGQQGLLSFLEQIQFEFTDEDRAEMHETLEELKGGDRE